MEDIAEHEKFERDLNEGNLPPFRFPVPDIRDSEDGVEDVSLPNPGGGGGNIHPFQLVKGTDESGDPTVFVRKGTVRLQVGEIVVPTLGGDELNDDHTENDLSVLGSLGDLYYIKLISTGILGEDGVTSAEIVKTKPTVDSSIHYILLGSVVMDGSTVESITCNLTGSQIGYACGITLVHGSA